MEVEIDVDSGEGVIIITYSVCSGTHLIRYLVLLGDIHGIDACASDVVASHRV